MLWNIPSSVLTLCLVVRHERQRKEAHMHSGDYGLRRCGACLEDKPAVNHLTKNMDTLEAARGERLKSPTLRPDETRHLIVAPLIEDGIALEVRKPRRIDFKMIWRNGRFGVGRFCLLAYRNGAAVLALRPE